MDRRQALRLFGITGAGLGLGCTHAEGAPHDAAGGKEGPLHSHQAFFCGIHMAKKDPKFQLITQHYCAAHVEDGLEDPMYQCVLFDSTGKNAKLLGVEYIISDRQYRKLPDEEKPFWHAHTYEVLGGGLIAPEMKPEDEMAFMKGLLTTWGKAWHTWPDPKSPVPMGEPLLIWSLMGDGQVDEKVLATRDREFKVDTAKISEKRIKEIGLQPPNVAPPTSMAYVGRQWTNEGEDKPTKTR